MKKLTLGAIALAASTVIGSAASHANYIGSVWTGVPGPALNATVANAPTTTPNATFTTTSINYTVPNSDNATVGSFLLSGGTTCVGAGCGTILDNSYFLISTAPGFLSTNTNTPITTVSITHDDGVQLIGGVNGLLINSPGPTSPITSTNPAGTPWTAPQTVQLAYGECCSGPAVLQATLGETPIAAPEPASLAILGAALAGFGVVMRRRRKTS